MKRIVLMMVGILSALVVAEPSANNYKLKADS
jgi:hypothetical protein